MKMRILLSATMMASLLTIAPQAFAHHHHDHDHGDFLDRMEHRQDRINDRIDRKIDKIHDAREHRERQVNEIRDRIRNAPERERERFHDRLDRLDGRRAMADRIHHDRAEAIHHHEEIKHMMR